MKKLWKLNKHKRMETSKKLLLFSYISAVILSVIVILGTFSGTEVSNITTLAALAWGEVAVSNAFYYRKAGHENGIKIISSLDKDIQNQIDINSIING